MKTVASIDVSLKSLFVKPRLFCFLDENFLLTANDSAGERISHTEQVDDEDKADKKEDEGNNVSDGGSTTSLNGALAQVLPHDECGIGSRLNLRPLSAEVFVSDGILLALASEPAALAAVDVHGF